MAKATVRTNLVVYLELSSEEALWLKGLTQNFWVPETETETENDRKIRRAIFEALTIV